MGYLLLRHERDMSRVPPFFCKIFFLKSLHDILPHNLENIRLKNCSQETEIATKEGGVPGSTLATVEDVEFVAGVGWKKACYVPQPFGQCRSSQQRILPLA